MNRKGHKAQDGNQETNTMKTITVYKLTNPDSRINKHSEVR